MMNKSSNKNQFRMHACKFYELEEKDQSSNEFWMYKYKIVQCPYKLKYCWDCPDVHDQEDEEKVKRRSPRHFHYRSQRCPDFRDNSCPRENNCKFSHGLYEYWFHPSRFRTRMCRYGKSCDVRDCFFAHTPRQLRRVLALHALDGRRWEDLNEGCLVEIFQKLSLEDLVYVVPYVCKSWHKASSNPYCWKFLDFHQFQDSTLDIANIDRLIEFVVDRSRGVAIEVSLPEHCFTLDALDYVANRCPALRILNIEYSKSSIKKEEQLVAKAVCKWKILEVLSLSFVGDSFKDIVAQINIHCKNFVMLNVYQVGPDMDYDKAFAIVCNLSNKIKYLGLIDCIFSQLTLKSILDGCPQLELLDISNSWCKDVNGEVVDVSKMVDSSSGMEVFRCDNRRRRR